MNFLIFTPAIFSIVSICFILLGSLPRINSCLHPILVVVFSVCLGFGIGTGVSSLIYFSYLLFWGSFSNQFIFFEISLITLSCLGSFILFKKHSLPQSIIADSTCPTYSVLTIPILGGFLVFFVISLNDFIQGTLVQPHGSWDSWAIWTLRARFITLAGEQWENAFSPLILWTHPDYPVLLPFSIARAWSLLGNESKYIPALIAFGFTYSIIGSVIAGITYLKNLSQGLLAGLFLVVSGQLINYGVMQYADIPLSFFILGTCIMIALANRFHHAQLLFITICGLLSGFATWTKNEGIPFFLITSATLIVTYVWNYGLRNSIKILLVYLIGAILPLIAVTYFKLTLAPTNDIMGSLNQSSTAYEKILSWERYCVIARESWPIIRTFFSSLLPFLGVYLLLPLNPQLSGSSYEPTTRKQIFAIICAVLTCYTIILLLTPNEIVWHMKTAADRLFIHIYPTVIFLFFLSFPTPENLIVGLKDLMPKSFNKLQS